MKDVKIADYLWFQEGPGVRNTQYTTSGVKLINVANLVDGNVDLSTSDRYISEEEAYGKYNHFLADDGDFVIASSGIKIDYFDKKMGFIKKEHLPLCMNTSCIRFKVLDTNNLEIKYFMYYLKSNSFKKQLFNQITGSAQLNFGPSHLKKMTFPLIELKEQKRIIERLDKTQNIINETKSLLSKYDTLIKSRFIEMFGDPITNPKHWNTKAITELCENIMGGGTPSKSKPEYFEGTIPWVSPKDMKSLFILDSQDHITEDAVNNSSAKKIKSDSILMVIRSGILKHTLPVAMNKVEVTINQDMKAFIPSSEINPYYLLFYFKGIERDVLSGVRAVTADNIDFNQFKKRHVILPPKQMQDDFASFVQQIDKSKFEIWLYLNLCYIIEKRVFTYD